MFTLIEAGVPAGVHLHSGRLINSDAVSCQKSLPVFHNFETKPQEDARMVTEVYSPESGKHANYFKKYLYISKVTIILRRHHDFDPMTAQVTWF